MATASGAACLQPTVFISLLRLFAHLLQDPGPLFALINNPWPFSPKLSGYSARKAGCMMLLQTMVFESIRLVRHQSATFESETGLSVALISTA